MGDPGRARVLVIVGTRPEGIKLAPVLEALRARDGEVETRLALTGQHTDLLDQVLECFALIPDWDLGIMRDGQSLYDIAHGCLDGVRDVVGAYRPHMVLVQGDTASVFFGALVAGFEQSLVGHVEAGLRSGHKQRPFPEEILRRLTGVLADLHFAPTPAARDNLLAEGVPAGQIHVTGNTVVDALERARDVKVPVRDAALRRALASRKRLVLVTVHRRETFGAPLRGILSAVRALADRFQDVVFLYPVHPNPNVLGPAREILRGHERILLTRPLAYADLLRALRAAVLTMTDSGGIQEEAPSFGTPVLVLRETTERPEGVGAGVARVVGTDAVFIAGVAGRLLSDHGALRVMTDRPNPYGDGRAAARIADIITHALTGRPRKTTDWSGEEVATVPARPEAGAERW